MSILTLLSQFSILFVVISTWYIFVAISIVIPGGYTTRYLQYTDHTLPMVYVCRKFAVSKSLF